MRLRGVIVGATDPAGAARFWDIVVPGATGPRFVRARTVASRSRIHLDLACAPDAFDEEVRRLINCGAVRVGPPRAETYGRNQIFLDPTGLPFCLNAYNNDDNERRESDQPRAEPRIDTKATISPG